ncbi:MAG: T6SS effector amidase Tae4 family protein [Myxococcota bacterium]
MAHLRNFEAMWDAYPNPGGTAAEAKATIGGAVDRGWIRNTCVVRVSRSFNASGNAIPAVSGDEIFTVRGGDGRNYALRVHEFRRYLQRKYGRPDVEHTYAAGEGGPVPEGFRGKRGVVVFDVEVWRDATGHVDLWNGDRCRHAEYFDVSTKVMLWEVDEAPSGPVLSDSVGARARNRDDDVLLVQTLLLEQGYDPGPLDGKIGRKTIAAIREFQRRFLRRPDGRVDPGGRTFRELQGL